jgi:predicted DCC family thiol-disulfide oxidoreductase YuxK
LESKHSIILFDGVCNLCNGFVNFLIERDKKGMFKFASLQSQGGQDLLKEAQPQGLKGESIVLIEGSGAYMESSAALRILGGIGGAWKLFYIFMIVPPFIRNSVYRLVARNRYKWFGKMDSCRLPTPELKSRFL